jgi:hypothetical protein
VAARRVSKLYHVMAVRRPELAKNSQDSRSASQCWDFVDSPPHQKLTLLNRSIRSSQSTAFAPPLECLSSVRSGVQLRLGHSKLESTVRYLGIGVDDALEIAEQTEV